MAKVTVAKNTYTIEPVYQWDLNQELEIHGMSFSTAPEVHFAHEGMAYAIVRKSTLDAAGVIRAKVPNSLLQKAQRVNVYLCTYEGNAFQTVNKFVMPVHARNCPADYDVPDEYELYDFTAMDVEAVTLECGADVTVDKLMQGDKVILRFGIPASPTVVEVQEGVIRETLDEAKDYADKAATSEAAAKSAQTAAEAAKAGAETAQAGADAAKNSAETARVGADTAKAGAEAAKAGAETAKAGAEAAQAAAEEARNAAQEIAGGNFVPVTRTVNGKALNENITLAAEDVGAAAVGHTHTAAEVGAATADHKHTAAEVGAATADHKHTAVEVGAATADHKHTAEEVGAATADHKHTAEEVGAAAENHTHTPASIGAAPAYTYGTTAMTANSSALTTGTMYLQYK